MRERGKVREEENTGEGKGGRKREEKGSEREKEKFMTLQISNLTYFLVEEKHEEEDQHALKHIKWTRKTFVSILLFIKPNKNPLNQCNF